MPPSRKRPASSSDASVDATPSNQEPKRRRASQTSPAHNETLAPGSRRTTRQRQVIPDDDDDVFAEGSAEKKKKKSKLVEEDDDIIDLATSNEVPEEVPKEDKRIKFNKFQCAICMDSATNVAVTHCGHLFCSECLQNALDMEIAQRKCPICRQKIDSKERTAYNSKTKGFWHLELKLMTAKKGGKQPSR